MRAEGMDNRGLRDQGTPDHGMPTMEEETKSNSKIHKRTSQEKETMAAGLKRHSSVEADGYVG